MTEQTSPFTDLDAYVALPRVAGLALSPDGSRLATTVATLDRERTKWITAVWEVDSAGERPARRLTRSAKGEAGAAYLPDGGLLFCSARPDPDVAPDDDAPPALWLLPPGGGEARVVARRAGGIGGPVVARDAGTVVVSSMTLPSAVTAADDEARRKARKEGKVTAVLHHHHPVRYWDHDLGPDTPRLLSGPLAADESVEFTDLTPQPGAALFEAGYDVTADGATVVTTWSRYESAGASRSTLVVIDVASGERRVLADTEGFEFSEPRISPDGTQVVAVREALSTPFDPPVVRLVVLPLAGGEEREVAPGWDRWGHGARWTPDGSALLVVAAEAGAAPVFRIEVGSGEVTRLTGDHGAYSDLQVAPDGAAVYALRSAVDAAPAPVRLDPAIAGQQPTYLPAPADLPDLPGHVEEVTATAADGTPLRAWLVLPDGASAGRRAPLVLWIHGGPLSSWNDWSWRWNPWLMAARGWAVLLPDPGLSTGYGQDFVRRGWGAWGREPYTDLMSVTDAALERADLDAERTAAMGGSFGGYMANWVAGHTDRFRAIVTHASLWALDQFGATTDAAWYWTREMTPEMALANSPHLHADAITTPMLVVHGDKDYRVPIGEGLRLWWDLASRSKEPDGSMPHRFLYYPDENHWVLTPRHAKIWYEVVLGFLGEHTLGEDWEVPDLLR